jgi:LiaF transmembrane domain
MNSVKRRIDGDQIFWGLFLIAAGAILLLQRLGVADMSWTMRHFWPLIIIVIGVSKLFHRGTIWASLWMMAIGVWLQMVTLHIYGFTYRSSWPLLLIILGGGMVLRTIAESARRRDAEEGDHHV